MNLLQSVILGLVQGLTEFLPVSSSGHLLVFENLLGVSESSALLTMVLMHVGTLVAVAIVFWKDWVQMLLHPIKNHTLVLLFIASLPALAFKVLFGDLLDSFFTGWFLGFSFLITALFLVATELFSKHGRHAQSKEIRLPQAVTMGVFQGIALLPGVSRSGSTILGGILSGVSRRDAAKFSFMMSAPAILGSVVVEGKTALEAAGSDGSGVLVMAAGMLVAGISGYIAIKFMLALIQKVSFLWFALYVAILGIVVIILQINGVAGFAPIVVPDLSAVKGALLFLHG